MSTFLGFDFGTRKIGIAVGQLITRSATPLTTLRHRQQRPDWAGIERIVRDWQPQGAVLGLPYHMDDREEAWADQVRRFARQLQGRFQLQVHLIDERLTSLEARRTLGLAASARDEVIDAMAATLILETWLSEQSSVEISARH